MTDAEKLEDLKKKRNHIRYQIRKIAKKTDEDLKAKDVKDLQKYNDQIARINKRMATLREKIKKKQVTSAYQTVTRRAKLTDISKSSLLARNYYNTDWLDGHEHLTKMAIVQNWQQNHPFGTKTQCQRDTNMSHHTIDKWWLG